MDQILSLAAENLLSPIILFFVLGFAAAYAKSDLTVPEAVAKAMSLYLLFAIGFKGGASVADHGVDGLLVMTLIAAVMGLPSVPASWSESVVTAAPLSTFRIPTEFP